MKTRMCLCRDWVLNLGPNAKLGSVTDQQMAPIQVPRGYWFKEVKKDLKIQTIKLFLYVTDFSNEEII